MAAGDPTVAPDDFTARSNLPTMAPDVPTAPTDDSATRSDEWTAWSNAPTVAPDDPTMAAGAPTMRSDGAATSPSERVAPVQEWCLSQGVRSMSPSALRFEPRSCAESKKMFSSRLATALGLSPERTLCFTHPIPSLPICRDSPPGRTGCRPDWRRVMERPEFMTGGVDFFRHLAAMLSGAAFLRYYPNGWGVGRDDHCVNAMTRFIVRLREWRGPITGHANIFLRGP